MTKHGKKFFSLIMIASILAAGLSFLIQPPSVYAAGPEGRGGPGGRGGAGAGTPLTGPALTPLSETEKSILQEAILEEYGALNLYNSVIAQMGSIVPFTQIARSEQQHVNALVNLASKYGVGVPANPGLPDAPVFTSTASACQAGVDAEIADAALYDQLKPRVTHPDILQVFDNLRNASLNSHLPAFETCN